MKAKLPTCLPQSNPASKQTEKVYSTADKLHLLRTITSANAVALLHTRGIGKTKTSGRVADSANGRHKWERVREKKSGRRK